MQNIDWDRHKVLKGAIFINLRVAKKLTTYGSPQGMTLKHHLACMLESMGI